MNKNHLADKISYSKNPGRLLDLQKLIQFSRLLNQRYEDLKTATNQTQYRLSDFPPQYYFIFLKNKYSTVHFVCH